MQDRLPDRSHRRRPPRTGLLLTVTGLTVFALIAASLGWWESYRRRTQMQNDPRVARVWVAGVTFGRQHRLERGTRLQQWLNSRRITALGEYEVVSGQYANDPGAMEIWFNYESYLMGRPDLECHRINASGTAFVDDLGQPYHGFLDIHGRTVGVYLPGYDHSAHEIRCIVQWMPRRPAAPYPVSRPTVFTVKLPPVQRTLPPAATLPRTVSRSVKGITVTVDAARLGPPKLATGAAGQRDLTFHLKIEGGEIANDNMANDLDMTVVDPRSSARIRALIGTTSQSLPLFSGRPFLSGSRILQSPALLAQRRLRSFATLSYEAPAKLTDPHGIEMLAPGQSIAPLIAKDTIEAARHGKGMVWVASVNNAGKGTDAVRLHFDVLPKSPAGRKTPSVPAALVPFDLCIPVQTGDEI